MDKNKKYKIGAIAGLFAALIYLLVPVEIIPDAVPVLGWIDDVVAILLAVANAIRLVIKIKER